jgi:hypothetical protein
MNTDTWSVVESFLDFETLVALGSPQAIKAYDPKTHTWVWAAENGLLDVVKWLHFNRMEGCTDRTMIQAAWNGHLEVVKWLHENHKEGYAGIIIIAAMRGHFEMVKWLYCQVVVFESNRRTRIPGANNCHVAWTS